MTEARFSEHELRAYVAGAATPWQRVRIEDAAAADPTLAAELERLRAALEAASPTDEALARRWYPPPPGVRGAPFIVACEVAPVAVLFRRSRRELRPGDRFELVFGPVPDAEQRQVVILYRAGSGWAVVRPKSAEEQVRLSVLPMTRDGRYHLLLPVQRELGVQGWAIVLPLATDEERWERGEPERWVDVQRQLAEGAVPVLSWQIEAAGWG